MIEKQCSKCKKTKDVSAYVRRPGYKYGIKSICKQCTREIARLRSREMRHEEYMRNKVQRREHELKKRYGLNSGLYNKMLIKQDYLCAICGRHQSESMHGRLFVDHCHETNRVRGLLCNSCNLAIGQLKHNITILNKAITYLAHE